MRRTAPFLRILLLIMATAAVDAESLLQRWHLGDIEDAQVETRPGLLLLGGGGDVDEAFRLWLKGAEGGDVVVLRASGTDGYNEYIFKTLGVPLDSVETLRFDGRDPAFDPAVERVIREAEALFIAGGDQSRYVRFWRDTPVERAVNDHLAAGRPVGGTSAGLAVLGEFAYTAMHRGDLTSAVALADPFDPLITLGSGFLRAPPLRGFLTDSHFSERGRLGRLLVMLARLKEETNRGDLVGLGLDEQTALLVDGEGRGRVFSAGSGRVSVVALRALAPLQRGQPVGPLEAAVIQLDADSTLHLSPLHVDRPAALASVRIEGGRLRAVDD